ncbi:MAG: hypothetical protein VCA74_07855 [Deltaproteobacteria bacterium]
MAGRGRTTHGWVAAWLRLGVSDPAEARFERRVAMLVVVVALLAVANVWIRLSVQDLGHKISMTATIIDDLDHEHEELEIIAGRQEAPELLRRRATAQRLRAPLAGQVIAVNAPGKSQP